MPHEASAVPAAIISSGTSTTFPMLPNSSEISSSMFSGIRQDAMNVVLLPRAMAVFGIILSNPGTFPDSLRNIPAKFGDWSTVLK